jgi:two-component system CheB/CheR fusion protein
VKNTLAVIQSMTRQTLRSNSDPEKFVTAFEGRIRSLAASHSLLTDVDWKGAGLVDILRSQLEGMVDSLGARFTFRGPDVMVSTGVATQLGLVIHELGTNASKYGALSTNDGHIDVVWTVYGNKLRLSWRERGGPAVTGDTKYEGFGTALFRSTSSKVTRRFLRKGFSCRLEIAL